MAYKLSIKDANQNLLVHNLSGQPFNMQTRQGTGIQNMI